MAICDERCKECYYGSEMQWIDGKYTLCQYILIEHRERLCEAGKNCNKFKPKSEEQPRSIFFTKTLKGEIELAKSKRLHTVQNIL